MVAWLVVADSLSLKNVVRFLAQSAGLPREFPLSFLEGILFWLPPMLVAILCQTLSHPVHARVRQSAWTQREIFNAAAWGLAASILPLVMAIEGLMSLLAGSSRAGVLWLAAAIITRQFGVRRLLSSTAMTSHALTTGELRDRAFAIAAKLGVKLQQLYVLPAAKGRVANAFARSGNSILLTDYLLEHLTKREVDAVLAHEMSHLKLKHPRKLTWAFLASIGGAVIVATGLARMGQGPRPWFYAGVVLVPLIVAYFFSRRFEFAADATAVQLTGDPEASITSLVKLNRLNLLPIHWSKWNEKFLTHPSTMRRV